MRKITALLLALLMLMSTALSVSATMPPQPKRFTDVSKSAWYTDNVNYVTENGLMKGTSETTFSPDMTLSRAMVVTILYRMAGETDVEGFENKFTDVPSDEWYTSAVLWACENYIAYGRYDKTFAPSEDITRQELATMLFRYVQKFTLSLPYDPTYPAYADADSISVFAEPGVIVLSRAGIINGKDGNRFDPKASATRAEAAALFSRFVEKATVQDFSLIEKLGAGISFGAYITKEKEWELSPFIYTLLLDVFLHGNSDELFNTEILVSIKLYTESGDIKYDLKRDDGILGSSFSYAETPSAYVEMDDVICADVTVTSEGESETYRYFSAVHEMCF